MDWNEYTAYAIGLIATDGSLSKDGRHITFVSKDIELIRLFKNCLSLKNKVSTKTSGYSRGEGKYYFIQFGNVVFYKDLLKIGLTPNKSKSIGKVQIPKKYFADFLRGHIDGDGYMRTYNDPIYRNSKRLYITLLSASEVHIRWLQGQISKLYMLSGKVRAVPRAWTLVYAKKESRILLHKIYYKHELPFLARKRDIIKEYL